MNSTNSIEIKVIPKSSKSTITVLDDNTIKVHLNSPPVDGKSNKECIELLTKALNIPKSSITIEKGLKGKHKTIAIAGMTADDILAQLRTHGR